VQKTFLGKDSFQEVDIAGVVMPVTKHSFIVKDIEALASTLRRAFYIAREGRPGPVLVDITQDVTAASCEYAREVPKEITRKTHTITEEDLDTAAKLINDAERPFIYAGGGIISSDASKELKNFADKIDAPVTLSLMGLGGFDSADGRYTGMVGIHGTKASNMAATECDLLICIGARFSDRVISNVEKFAPAAKILHFDIDAAEINKNVKVAASCVGDAREILARLDVRLKRRTHPEWMAKIMDLKEKFPLHYPNGSKLHPQYILQRINAIAKSDAIIVTDVGQHQMWAGQYISYSKPRTFISSGGLGTMGFGLGAAIGAAIGKPDKTVFNITGDGCFRMNNIELATAVEYNVPIIDVIMNNHTLGMVRQWQTFFYGGRYSHTTMSRTMDYIKLAEAHGALGINVEKPEEVDEAIKTAMAAKRPVVLNCDIDCDEKVFPMVAPGAGIDELRLE
jgi:acetolactate synthase-1/2/3 large subunit